MVGRVESGKDVLQEVIESGAGHVGRIASLITGVVRDVTREIGDFATDVFEMLEAQRQARSDDAD